MRLDSSVSSVTHHELSRVMTKPRAADSSDDLASSSLLQRDDVSEHSDSGQEQSSSPGSIKGLILRLRICFFLFGTINNGMSLIPFPTLPGSEIVMTVLYVIILSAALDLVPTGTPKVC